MLFPATSRILPSLSAGILLAAASGCQVGPDYKAPQTETPAAFAAGAQAAQDARLAAWWDALGDATLSSLVEEALANSPDAKTAAAKVKEARATLDGAGGVLWPSANASASYARSGMGSGSRGFQFAGNTFRAGLDASWEIDVFGGNQRMVEAAGASYEAQVELGRAVRVALSAEVATSYIQLQSAQARLFIVRANLATQEETLRLAEMRFKAGLSTEAPVLQAKAQLAGQKARIAPLEQVVAQSRNTLAVLVGRQPWRGAATAPVPASPPDPTTAIPVGLPSDLLRRRPDIRAAERQLAAATAQIGVATAELFPKFALTGSISHSSLRAQDLLAAKSRMWSVGPSVSFRLFDRSRIKAQVRAENARTEQALLGYEKAVLVGLADAENALIACDKGREQFAAQAESVAASQRSRALSKELYEKGLGDFLDVLVADRALFDAREQLESSRAQQTLNLIALYKAVGGGWEAPSRR